MKNPNLTSVENVKEYLGIADATDADDILFNRLIRAASDFIRTYIGRDITDEDYNERLNGNGSDRMVMRNYPIISVRTLAIDGVSIPAAKNFRESGYLFDADTIYLVGYRFTRGVQNVVISYSAGYEEVPFGIEQACIDLVSLKYRERERVGVQSKTLATEQVTYKIWDLTESAKNMLNGYQRRTPV